MERDILIPSNLKFVRDADGNIADVTNPRADVEGSLAIKVIEAEEYSPEILMQALDAAERAEKEFMRTGQRNLTINEKPGMDNIDFERAVILSNLLDGPSLKLLAARGGHGAPAGNRMAKIDTVQNLLYKGTYGRDPYTNSPILGVLQDQGHLESNSRGGKRLRPEISLVNQWLRDTEGKERLEAIAQARQRMGAAANYNSKMLEAPEIKNLLRFKDFQDVIAVQDTNAQVYGYR